MKRCLLSLASHANLHSRISMKHQRVKSKTLSSRYPMPLASSILFQHPCLRIVSRYWVDPVITRAYNRVYFRLSANTRFLHQGWKSLIFLLRNSPAIVISRISATSARSLRELQSYKFRNIFRTANDLYPRTQSAYRRFQSV